MQGHPKIWVCIESTTRSLEHFYLVIVSTGVLINTWSTCWSSAFELLRCMIEHLLRNGSGEGTGAKIVTLTNEIFFSCVHSLEQLHYILERRRSPFLLSYWYTYPFLGGNATTICSSLILGISNRQKKEGKEKLTNLQNSILNEYILTCKKKNIFL